MQTYRFSERYNQQKGDVLPSNVGVSMRMGRNELRYLYIGSIAIASLTAISGGAFLGLWNSGTFGTESTYLAGLELLILLGLALTGMMCLLCWLVALSNLRDRAVGSRAAAVSVALSMVTAASSLAYPAATALAFGIFLVSLLALLVVGVSAALGYARRRYG